MEGSKCKNCSRMRTALTYHLSYLLLQLKSTGCLHCHLGHTLCRRYKEELNLFKKRTPKITGSHIKILKYPVVNLNLWEEEENLGAVVANCLQRGVEWASIFGSLGRNSNSGAILGSRFSF